MSHFPLIIVVYYRENKQFSTIACVITCTGILNSLNALLLCTVIFHHFTLINIATNNYEIILN